MQQIIVYADEGVDGTAFKQTVKSLQQISSSVRRIDAKGLTTTDWEEKTALLVIPGGRDLYYHRFLDGVGTARIRSFVESGGSYLGICAGAYFGAAAIEFEKGRELEVCGPRSLGFFPGIAAGPSYGPNRYRYDSLQGVEAALISWKESSCHVYFNGGCHFVGAANHPTVEIVSSYLEIPEQPAAVIACSVGKGKAILSGVHPEYQAPSLDRKNRYLAKLYPLLEKSENLRREFFHELCFRLIIKKS